MSVLLWVILATLVNGLVAFVGALAFWFKDKALKRLLIVLVAFAAGALLGGGILHLFVESLATIDASKAAIILMVGFSVFFLVEKFLHWHHCHQGLECKHKPYTYIILFGDGIHNFIDGLAIAASFLVDIRLGLITTLIIILHEIPQELGDFAILVQGGMAKGKALFYNFISQLTAVLGGVIGVLAASALNLKSWMLPFVAGGFIYIAASDLIPEFKQDESLIRSLGTFAIFVLGILFMILTKYYLGE